MRLTRSLSSYLLAILLALIFVTASYSADGLNGAGHTMPAFIDLEYTELRADESSSNIVINIFRSGDFRQTTTINYQTTAIEASEGQDYKGAGGSITFQPGEGYKTIILEILHDDEAEQPESFRFDVSPGGPNCIVSRASAVIWIDDTAATTSEPRLEIAAGTDHTVLISWESSRLCTLEQTLDPASANWEPSESTPEVYGNRYQVVHVSDGPIYFFRLRTE